MVVKRHKITRGQLRQFESSVISYGSQAIIKTDSREVRFESSVISYGSQAPICNWVFAHAFESSVILCDSKT